MRLTLMFNIVGCRFQSVNFHVANVLQAFVAKNSSPPHSILDIFSLTHV